MFLITRVGGATSEDFIRHALRFEGDVVLQDTRPAAEHKLIDLLPKEKRPGFCVRAIEISDALECRASFEMEE